MRSKRKEEGYEKQTKRISGVYHGNTIWNQYDCTDRDVYVIWRMDWGKISDSDCCCSVIFNRSAGRLPQYIYYGKKDLSGRSKKIDK